MMETALVLAVLLAASCAYGWWNAWDMKRRTGRLLAQAMRNTLDAHSQALSVLWHHVHPVTLAEEEAVATLRKTFPSLPEPDAGPYSLTASLRWSEQPRVPAEELAPFTLKAARDAQRPGPPAPEADPFHPTGRCTCASEGTCERCRGGCPGCGARPPHDGPCPDEPELHEPIGCGTFHNLPSGPSWPQCACLRFNPPGAKSCARCGATPPRPRVRKEGGAK